jgi:glycosyltransferase involved in cell wall biosynthesis
MNRLTATLITLNEERNLPRALASVAGLAEEVVVVDSSSRDRTVALARQHGARVFERAWTDYSEQKNFAAAQATHDWILSLDADEELSPALREEIAQWKQGAPEADAYEMPRKAQYLGRWIEHSGWYPDRKRRLYRRDRARFVGALHESLVVEGTVGRFRNDLLHYTFDSLEEHEARVQRYTQLAARLLYAGGRRSWLLPWLLAPGWAFLRTFIFQQGFRDGRHGWLIARMAARYVRLKYSKLRALVEEGARESEARSRAA